MNVMLPNQSVVQFPDDMPSDQISKVIDDHLASSSQQEAQPSTDLERFGHGMMDAPNAIAQAYLHYANAAPMATILPGMILPTKNEIPALEGADKYIDQSLSNQDDLYRSQREAAGSTGIDWDRMLGNMVSTAPVAAIMPGAAATTLAGRAGSGALSGTAFGLMQPVTSGMDNYGTQKLTQGVIGAGTGAVLSPAIGAVSDFISPNISSEAKTLMDQGITPTPGQLMGGSYKGTEEKLSSIPYLGDIIKTGQKRALDQFNTAALGRALEPIGEDAPQNIGRAGIQHVSNKLSEAYERVLPNLVLPLNDTLTSAVQDARADLPEVQQKAFDSILNRQFQKFGDSQQISGNVLKGFQSEITSKAKGYLSDSSFDSRQLGSALDDVRGAIGKTLEEANPSKAPELAAINRGYANYAILRRAASANNEDAPFTPAQLASAIKFNDKSVGRGAFAKGNALMQDLSDPAVSVLGSDYPDSGTMGRGLMAALGGSLATGHFSLPIALASGAASLPYLNPTAQKIAAQLLSVRPKMAPAITEGIRNMTPYLLSGATGSAASQ